MKLDFLRAKKYTALVIALLITLSLCGCGEKKKEYPEHAKEFYVNDFADIMTQEDEKTVYSQGIALQEKTKAQAVVITIENLDDKPIEEYALEIGREWGVGDGEKDNGIVVLLSKSDSEIYIAVGEGLEGALPDSKVGRIIDTYAMPHLSSKKYSPALKDVYKSIVNEVYIEYNIEIDEDYTPMADIPVTQQEAAVDGTKILISWIVLVVLVAVYVLVFGRRGLFIFGAPRFFGGFHFHGGGSFGGGSFGGFKGGGGSFGGGGAGRKF